MVITRFILDLKLPQSQTAVYAVRDDTDITWQISFSDGGNEYILPDNVVAEMQIVRPKSKTTITSICKKINNTTVEYNFVTGYDEEGNPIDVRHTAGETGIHTCTVVLWAMEEINGKLEKVKKEAPKFTFMVREKVITNESNIQYTPKDENEILEMARNETVRINNENIRISNENARNSNENTRNENENTRQINESERIEYENSRQIAEQARNDGETSREKRLNSAITDATKAISGAEEKLDKAIDTIEQRAEDGEFDGFSPTVAVEELAGGLGYKVIFTDVDGEKSFFVYNGKTGEAGTVARYTVHMELNHSTYKLKMMLKDELGNVVSEDTVDFPIEEMVVGADEENGTVTLTLKNGNTVSFYIGDLVEGLVSQAQFDTLKNAVPIITTTPVTDGYKITFTDNYGSQDIVLKNGENGEAPPVYVLSGKIQNTLNGSCSVTLYKDGQVCQDTLYLFVEVASGTNAWRTHSSSTGNITGTKSWTYGGDMNGIAWKCEVYTNSSKTKLLASCFMNAGAKGDQGGQGSNGVGISKIEKTATDGDVDTYTITLTNGNTYSFTVTNGTDGADGKDGSDYVLTEEDKTEIAEKAAKLVDTTDKSVVGTWVFKNELTIPQAFRGRTFSFAFNTVVDNEPRYYKEFYFLEDGREIAYHGDVYADEGVWSDGQWYIPYNTITITEEPTDPEFKTWLKASAEKSTLNEADKQVIIQTVLASIPFGEGVEF